MELRVKAVAIPLQMSFSQASKNRTLSASILATVELNGHVGLGEGAPRPYVTGETLEGALTWIEAVWPAVKRDVSDFKSLQAFVSSQVDEIDQHPAAWCALEMAMLDVFARVQGVTLEALLDLPVEMQTVRYTAVIPSMSPNKTARWAARWRSLGATDYKLKVGVEDIDDVARLDAWRACFSEQQPRLRLDANNAWAKEPGAALAALRALKVDVDAVEEPLAPRSYNELVALGEALDVRIVLDESFAREADAEILERYVGRFIANVKVSKAGGLLRGLALVKRAVAAGASVIVGAHVAETSALTRAGLILAAAAGQSLHAIEGGAGTYLLSVDPVVPELRFGAGASLNPAECGLGPTGSGLSVDATKLANLAEA